MNDWKALYHVKSAKSYKSFEDLPTQAKTGDISYFGKRGECAVYAEDHWNKLVASPCDILSTLINNNCCISYIKTPEKLIKIEGNCPSCGAPITGEKCEYCGRVHYLRV